MTGGTFGYTGPDLTKERPGIKHSDLSNCIMCGEGVLHDRNITFYRVTVEYFVADFGAIQQAAGLEMMLGGNATLANAMGPDADLAKQVSRQSALLCLPCSMKDAGATIPAIVEQEDKPND